MALLIPGVLVGHDYSARNLALSLQQALSRHARPCAGHPRLFPNEKGVDGRDKPGHDG
jgi:hypothetical protein